MTNYFFVDPAVDMTMIESNKALKKLSESEIQDILRQAINKLQSVENWTANDLQTALNELLESTSRKPAELFGLIRLAVSFAPFSPALHDTLSVLGRERSLARLNAVITAYSRD